MPAFLTSRSRGASLALAFLLILAASAARAQSTKPAAGQAAAPAAPQVPTQPPANPVIAIIDIDRIMAQSTAAQGVRAEAEKYQKDIVDQENKARATLEAQQRDLDKQRPTLAADAFAAKEKAFNQNVAEQQRQAVLRRQAFERSANTAMGKVQEAMLLAARDISMKYNANFVLPKTVAMFFDPRADITGEIVEIINKKLARVEFPVPKIDASGANSSPPPGLATGGPGAAPSAPGGLNLTLPQR